MTIQTLLILFCGALFGVLMTFVAIGFCIIASEGDKNGKDDNERDI